MRRMFFSAVSRSARGLIREENQDQLCCMVDKGLFVVADGMGGGEEGARASQIVCEMIEQQVIAEDFLRRVDEIGAAIDAANSKIYAYSMQHRFHQMGSTVSLLAFDTNVFGRAIIAYDGDSRVYRIRNTKSELLTRDHSIGAELEVKVGGEAGAKFAARSNPLAHVLTRAVGTSAKVEVEWRKVDVLLHDRFLVCSDGVHDVIETAELVSLIGNGKLEDVATLLENAILDRGAPDNYSFILVEVGESDE